MSQLKNWPEICEDLRKRGWEMAKAQVITNVSGSGVTAQLWCVDKRGDIGFVDVTKWLTPDELPRPGREYWLEQGYQDLDCKP